MSSNTLFWIWKIIKGILVFTLFLVLVTWVTMGLWNFVIPSIFGLPTINWMQAAALLLLTRLLIGGGHYGWNKMRNRPMDRMHPMHTFKHWSTMSEEEKQQVKNYWKRKCSASATYRSDADVFITDADKANEGKE